MNFLRGFIKSNDSDWLHAGKGSSYLNLDESSGALSSCQVMKTPGCRVFYAPKEKPYSEGVEVPLKAEAGDAETEDMVETKLEDQVLVFQYRGKFHAIDHSCPHSSFPLSAGTPFDIEDFGVVLSAAISCPQHGWSFDMFTGMSDRAMYRLTIWEVQLRESADAKPDDPDVKDQDVWVRRKPRIG